MNFKGLRGQMTAVGLVSVFITIIVYASMYPVLDEVINSISDIVVSGSMTDIILHFLPAVILLTIVASTLAWTTPHREGGY